MVVNLQSMTTLKKSLRLILAFSLCLHSELLLAAVPILGIAGGSASGKSTLADEVEKQMSALKNDFGHVCKLSLDRYQHDAADVPKEIFLEELGHYNYDEPRGINLEQAYQDVLELKAGRVVDVPFFWWDKNKAREAGKQKEEMVEKLGPCGSLIVEGLHAFHDERLRAIFDVRVFVDHPKEDRLERRVARDLDPDGRNAPAEYTRKVFDVMVQPMHLLHIETKKDHAHFVIQGSQTRTKEKIEEIVEALRIQKF